MPFDQYFDDNFRRVAQWVSAFRPYDNIRVESQPIILSHWTSWAKLTSINVLGQDDSEQFDLGV